MSLWAESRNLGTLGSRANGPSLKRGSSGTAGASNVLRPHRQNQVSHTTLRFHVASFPPGAETYISDRTAVLIGHDCSHRS